MPWVLKAYGLGPVEQLLCKDPDCTSVGVLKDATHHVNAVRTTAAGQELDERRYCPMCDACLARARAKLATSALAPMASAATDDQAEASPATPTVPAGPLLPPARRRLVFDIPHNAPGGFCDSCRAPIAWITTRNGSLMPVEPAGDRRGESHFAHCPNAAAHRRRA